MSPLAQELFSYLLIAKLQMKLAYNMGRMFTAKGPSTVDYPISHELTSSINYIIVQVGTREPRNKQ